MSNIRKVKLKPGTVEIHTSTLAGREEIESVLKSGDDPHPDLNNAFADLVRIVYDILSLPRSWCSGAVKVTGVTFSESESGVSGAVITGQAKLDGNEAPFCFNTPHMKLDDFAPFDAERLKKVREEAASFITGKRAQLELLGADQTLTAASLQAAELAQK